MVAERSITAKLKLDKSQFSRGLAEAAAEAKAFERAMSGSGGRGRTIFSSLGDDADDFATSVDHSTTAVKSLNTQLGDGGRKGNAFSKGIEASNSHMALLVQYSLALGPALVPALAAAVPLATALGSGLAFAAVGAGTAVLAFQGVGDGLKAMNDYAIDPTEAHLKALNEAMDALGPAGRGFVVFLDSLRPKLQQLQDIAQEEMFPGIQEGIESLLTQMPLVKGVIESVASAMGDLAADTGEALTSPFWTQFFTYIKDEATPIISNFSTGFGKLFEGIAALVLDFAPLTSDIAAGFADMGRSFSEWAQGLPETEGFQEFIRYLRETGPQVIDTLGKLGTALLDIGVALSGAPAELSLKILNGLAVTLSALASSPLGPGLLATAVGLAALTRAIALWDTVQASAIMQFLGGRGAGRHLAPSAGIGGFFTALKSINGGQIAAVAGGITLLASSFGALGDEAERSTALQGGALGALLGGTLAGTAKGGLIGAGLGALTGGIMDVVHASDDLVAAQQRVADVMKEQPENFTAQAEALQKSAASLRDFQGNTRFVADMDGVGDALDRVKDKWEGAFGKSETEERTEEQERLTEQFNDSARGVSELARALGDADAPTGNYQDHLEQLTEIATNLGPALDHLHVSMSDIEHLGAGLDSDNPLLAGAAGIGMSALADDIAKYETRLISTKGKEKAVANALKDLGAEAGNTQENIDNLSQALDDLFSPALAYSQALDDWRQGLADLNKNLKGTDLSEFTTRGRENRQVIRDMTEDLLNLVTTDLQEHPNKGPAAVAQQLLDLRKQMIAAGRQAGLDGPKLQAFLDTLHLTPKDLKFVFDKAGIDLAKAKIKELANDIKGLPKDVKTDIIANGVEADATVKSLMKKYDGLSRADALTILAARDESTPKINAVLKLLKGLERDFLARVNVETGSSMGKILGVKLGLDSIDGRVATAYTEVRNRTINTVLDRHLTGGDADGSIHEYANGGMWPAIGAQQPQIQGNKGPGGIKWAETGAGPWEAFISGNPAKRDRSLAIWEETGRRLQAFADGGTRGLPGRRITSSDLGHRSVADDTIFIDRLSAALGRMRKEARQVERAEDRVHNARVRAREATQRLNKAERDEHTSKERLRRLQEQVTDATKHQTYVEKELAKQRDQLSKATQKWKDIQSRLLQQAQAASSQVLGQGDIFGGQGTSISVGGILAKLRQSGRDAREFNHYINRLRGMGVNERVIQQLLEQGPTPEGLAAARNLAHASAQQVRQINRAEHRLVGAAAAVGQTSISHNTNVNIKIDKIETHDARSFTKDAFRRNVRLALRTARSRS